ncbi:uncharacterized protein [Rutidosis leptorrhynchoides]|uniref:uncharacterized protein n=1 Tax=Rutidosis leptorrhynchoides TaxID=125765 RepID=UPI003A9A16AB
MTLRRRRLLSTFGMLILSVFQIVMKRMHISTTPNGQKGKILYAIKHHLLLILSFFDDHIIVVENIIETLVPSSTRVFNKIDDILKYSESLPSKIDDFMDHDVPTFIQRVPFIGRFFKKDDKEIVIDIACNGYRVKPETSFEYENVTKPGKEYVTDTSSMDSDFSDEKVVENEMQEIVNSDNEYEKMEDANEDLLYSARATSSNLDEIVQSDDQIIELFETGWHLSPRALSRSSSDRKSPRRS